MRPFEVGDLLTGKPLANRGVIQSVSDDGVIINCNIGGLAFFTFDDVKNMTVRKPRKGSKETRDIVAKLGWIFLMQLKFVKKSHNNAYRKYKNLPIYCWSNENEMAEYFKLMAFYKSSETAKSMLK